jgi:hypothetical protein
MSNMSIIHDLSEEIRRRIFAAMTSVNGISLDFTDLSNNIVFTPPDESTESNTKLSLYLYHIGINNSLRNQAKLPSPQATDGLLTNPLPLELKYLITPLSDELNNQLMMGRMLQYVYDFPYIDSIDQKPIGNSFGGASERVRITPSLLTVEQLAQMWNALNQPYRLALGFSVDVVAIDSAKPASINPRVAELVASAGHKGRRA